ncbi:MAG: methylmalonyl-CoA mutase family protein [Bacteroidales bacterium]
MSNKKLFTEFPPVATQDWEAVITKDLKGADYDKKLVWKTPEGIAVRPYYRSEDMKNIQHLNAAPAQFPFVRSTHQHNQWKVYQSYCACKDVKKANQQALDGLMKGVDAIGFCTAPKPSEEDVKQLLEGIYIENASVHFNGCKCSGTGLTQKLVAYAKSKNADLSKVRFAIDADPLRELNKTGHFCSPDIFAKLKNAINASAEVKHFRNISVSGATLHNAGANAVQELAFALSMGNEYLHQLTEQGLSVDEIAPRIQFTFAVGATYFMEIAKIRAARMLWANIVANYAPTTECVAKMHIHAVTSAWNQTAYDAYVNMLRGTTEAMSAAIAGVDSLEVLRFDKSFKCASEFSNRIARNTQVLLKEEAHLDQVVDPAAGSYYIETLTQSIAQEAWNLFKAVEDKGGYMAAFKAGFVQEQIKQSAQKRDANIASRREILLGTNQYPNFNETLQSEAIEKIAGKCKCSCSTSCEGEKIGEPLQIYRGANAFEALRIKTETSGKTPTAFMLTFGNLAMCRARAQFACNFFAVAGFKVVDNNCFESIEEGVKAAQQAGAQIVVACSSDDDYTTTVPQLAKMLDKEILVVAGEPACKTELEAAGISHFISVKSNVLETLKKYQSELGI